MPTSAFDPTSLPYTGFVPCPECTALLDDEGRCEECGYAPKDARIGLTLGDKYLVEELIGKGGMGAVYRAAHLELGEPVAVKFLLGDWARTGDLRTRFRREAVALARLRHPGVVSILDFGEHEGSLYLVMELVKGETLGALLDASAAPLPLLRLAGIFDQVLQVLEVAHLAKIVHRDLKPDNVMLTDIGDRVDRVKVLDFGLVRLDDGNDGGKLTQTGQVQGTPHYMSPEQCYGEGVGAPTDVYAVGIMLYETLAGVTPFHGSGMAAMMAQHTFVDPPPIASVGFKRAISPGLENVVRAALQKRAEHRPTAAALRDQLASAVKGTDPISLAAKAASDKLRLAGLSRSERALTGLRHEPVDLAPTNALTETGASRAWVVFWFSEGSRPIELRDSFAVHGLSAQSWSPREVPWELVSDARVRLLVVSAAEQGEERTRVLRGDVRSASMPVLVLDAADGPEVSRLIRAGASDVTLVGTADDDILRKAQRLLRRRR